jgi:type I restriction enzyme, S subunit
MTEWPNFTVAELQAEGVLLVEDGNHGEYRPRPTEFVEGGTAFIRAADMADGRVLFSQAGGINDIALARVRKGIGKPGDILFSHKGTVGKLARVPLDAPPFVCSPQTTFWRVLDESRLRRDYLYAFMRSKAFVDQWWVRKGETDMADYVSLTAQRQLRVTVPPIEMQSRIAWPLAAMDDLIDNNGRRIEVLEQMARSIYREWFVRLRWPGHEDAAVVESALGRIPDGWDVRRVAELASPERNAVAAGPFGSKLGRADYVDGAGVPVIRGVNLRVGGGFDEADFAFVSERKAHELRSSLARRGDIVITQRGTLGQVGMIPRSSRFERYVLSQSQMKLTVDPTICAPLFVYSQLRMPETTTRFVAQAMSSGVPHVNLTLLRGFELLIPPLPLQRRFGDIVEPLERQTWLAREQADRLTRLRNLLVPKLVTGQIDVAQLDLDALATSLS